MLTDKDDDDGNDYDERCQNDSYDDDGEDSDDYDANDKRRQ
jgi:hypothetical protein